MIFDKLSNISNYKILSENVVNFISNLSCDMKLGRYELAQDIYANVETYQTKALDEGKFESHDEFVDVQILLNGQEEIYYAPRENLHSIKEYDVNRDITFYNDSLINSDCITLDGTNFVVLFPHEAHAPQIAIDDKKSNVLKVVIKINRKYFL